MMVVVHHAAAMWCYSGALLGKHIGITLRQRIYPLYNLNKQIALENNYIIETPTVNNYPKPLVR